MQTSNPVFNVLVPDGNAAILGTGLKVSNLAVGQIGFFNARTHLSFVAADVALVDEFYIAVGIDKTASNNPADGGTLYNIIKSAGEKINKLDVFKLTGECYVAPVNKVVDITNFTAKCETDYGIKVGINSQAGYSRYGFNTPMKTFMVRSGCCGQGCNEGCTDLCNDVAYKLVNAINADTDQLLIAELLDYTTDPNNPVVVALEDYGAWVSNNSTYHDQGDSDVTNDTTTVKCLGIRVTTVASTFENYCAINLHYEFPRGTNPEFYFVEGFACAGKVETITDMVYEQGSGYDLRHLEYIAGGWENSPGIYRLSENLGMQVGGSFKTYASSTGKYVVMVVGYQMESVSAALLYKSNTETIIAIDIADTVTKNSVAVMLSTLLAHKPSIAATMSACASS